MAAARHNLSRRAVLGAGIGACAFVPSTGLSTVPTAAQRDALKAGRRSPGAESRRRWALTLDAYRRAEIRVAAFKAEEARLPAERRAFPCEALEERFARFDGFRLAALRRLLRLPPPDLPTLAVKLDLAVADQAWELDGCEDCLSAIAADLRRFAYGD